MSLALWLLVFLVLSYVIGKLFEVSIGWKTVTWVFYPGMLVAAFGRFLACLAGQQKPGQVDLMRAGGPGDPPGNLPSGTWFRFLYGVGPFLTSLLAFLLVWHFLDRPIDVDETLPTLGFEAAAAEEGTEAVSAQLSELLGELGDQRLGAWQLWTFLYLGFALIIAPAPSRNDLVNVGSFCALLGVGAFALSQAGVDVVADRVYGGAFWHGFSFMVAMAVLLLLASVLLIFPLKLLRRNPKE